jgi:hypothetical protein
MFALGLHTLVYRFPPSPPIWGPLIWLMKLIQFSYIHTPPYDSQIYSDSTLGMQVYKVKIGNPCLGLICIQRATAFVPHQSARSPNLYSCIFFRESMVHYLAYCRPRILDPIRLCSLIRE